MSQYDSFQDESDQSVEPVLPPQTRRDGILRSVPTPVFGLYFLINVLLGYIFYSVWWRVVPYVTSTMNVTEEMATIPAQIYLLFDYLFSIGAGILSDFKWTRYRVIFITNAMFFFAFLIQFILTFFMETIPLPYRGYPYGVILFFLASSQGMIVSTLMPFGIEQLDDDTDPVTRSSLLRWSVWFYQIGCCLAYPFIVLQKEVGNASEILVLATAAFIIFLFVICKRFYKFNIVSDGGMAVKHLKMALNRALGRQEIEDEEEDEEDHDWGINEREPTVIPENVKLYQASLLRRCVFLVLIFFTFGPYMLDFFMQNIVFPIQAKQMSHQTDPGPWFSVSYDVRASAIILIAIPLFDLVYRKSERFRPSNFIQIGVGMTFATFSLGTATLTHYLYGPEGIITDSKDAPVGDFLLTLQYVLMGLSKSIFLCAGYDLAYTESPAFLKGTGTGLFRGLGSVFGALIFFVQFFSKPEGVNHKTWPYAMMFAILSVTIVCMYIPLVKLYTNARSDSRRNRQTVEAEIQDISTAYISIQSS